MFLVNSRLGQFSAAASGLISKLCHPNAAPLIPKLRGQFAEFLNEGSPERLGILSLPTCVGLRYGHPRTIARGFSWQYGVSCFANIFAPLHPWALSDLRICLKVPPTGLDALFQRCAQPTLLRHPFTQAVLGGAGILTGCPSPTPLGLGLGPALP